jgi:DNA polymerase-4
VSQTIFDLFRSVTPLVEGLSLDEAYLDVTDNAWGEALAVNVARRLKQQIRDTTALTASAGVAPNKFLAKIASGWKKPDGLTVIAPDRVDAFLRKLPIDALWGVGPVTARKLRARNIERLVDVRGVDEAVLREAVGSMSGWLRDLAHGRDDRPVEPDRPAKSNGHETTYSQDLHDSAQIRTEVDRLARAAVEWVQRRRLIARTVQLKVRYADFETITRRLTRIPATADPEEVAARALALLARTEAGVRPVRLLGVSLQNFVTPEQEPGDWLPLD